MDEIRIHGASDEAEEEIPRPDMAAEPVIHMERMPEREPVREPTRDQNKALSRKNRKLSDRTSFRRLTFWQKAAAKMAVILPEN